MYHYKKNILSPFKNDGSNLCQTCWDGGAKIGKLKGTEKKLLIWLSGNRSST